MPTLKRLYPLLLTILLFPAAQLKGQVSVTDSLALVDLYNSTNGNGWTNKANWLTAQPVGDWYGITIASNRVYTIDLRNNNLTGMLPASIGNLSGLQSLQFDQNFIGGGIPNSMGNLISLQYLSMIVNQLTGTIPAALGNLTNLTNLSLASNQLSGSLPASLGNLSSLAYMHLFDNRFSGSIPPSFGNLSSMYEMILSTNQLTGTIPASLGNLTGIHTLELDFNQLTGSIPSSIGSLPKLSAFTVDFNQLSGPIPVFTGANFQYLLLQNNNFTFAGMEKVAQKIVGQKQYSPQATIPLHVSCGKLSVSVGGTPANNTYRWYDASGALRATIKADSTFTPAQPGNYYVTVSNSIAVDLVLHSDTSSGNVIVKKVNAAICGGQFYTLPSGKKVNTTGTYNDTIKTVSGCGDSLITQVNLLVIAPSVMHKTATICGGQFYTLPSGTQVNSPGIYHDTLSSVLGCDSIITALNLSVTNPVQKVNSATLCLGQQYRLPSGRVVSVAGIYQDTLRSMQGCDSIITTFTLTTDNSVTQVNDSVGICPGTFSLLLDAGNSATTYSWNTGSHSNAITVFAAGLYTAIVQGVNGCIANDSFQVLTYSAPVISLDKNIVLCSGQSAIINAGAGYTQYQWNTGSSSQSISIQTLGKYWVTVTDRYQCSGTDTTEIDHAAPSPSGFLPPDTTVCIYTSFPLGPVSAFENYSWSTGETTASIVVSEPGLYTLSVTDNDGCVGSDTININPKPCAEDIFVPNGFTPNGDGHNDVLRPLNLNHERLARFHFTIFNRWGQRIFESRNSSLGWDGKFQGTEMDTGVYVWQLEYQFPDVPVTVRKGTVVLLR